VDTYEYSKKKEDNSIALREKISAHSQGDYKMVGQDNGKRKETDIMKDYFFGRIVNFQRKGSGEGAKIHFLGERGECTMNY